MDFGKQSPASQAKGLTQVAATRMLLASRSVVAFFSRFFCRGFVYAYAAVALFSAKAIHIYAHRQGLVDGKLQKWAFSLYGQDTLVLILLRLLLNGWPFKSSNASEISGRLHRPARISITMVISYVIALSVTNVSFFLVSGTEIHWRNAALAGDASSRALLLTGLVSLLMVIGIFLAVAWLLQDVAFIAGGLAVDFLAWPLSIIFKRNITISMPDNTYASVTQHDDLEDANGQLDAVYLKQPEEAAKPRSKLSWKIGYIVIAVALVVQTIMCFLRPGESSLIFLSWTAPLIPLIDFISVNPTLSDIYPVYGTSIYKDWDDKTAVSEPISFPWLPDLGRGKSMTGFDDWYKQGKTHYNAAADPMKLDNLNEDLLPELRNKLHEAPIRHVVIAKLESTRKDVFPLKKDEIIWERFRTSFPDKKLPDSVIEKLQSLTPVANLITGDYDDGFPHGNSSQPARGGMNFENAYTSCTFTLKSLVGSLCGAVPMLVDFTEEHKNHIYQPCFPQILDAFNKIDHKESEGFASYEWKSYFMQTASLDFDNFDKLVPALGFRSENIISKEYLTSDSAKFGRVDLPNINYFGFQEEPLEDYIRDAFQSAKNNSERVFLIHVTSTTHHPYGIPKEEPYVRLGHGSSMDDLSNYVNAVGYDDRWLGKMLKYVEEEGVADETLFIFVGDHGLSLPENDIPATYYNPNVGGDHVPLVFSHPKMPPITIKDPVTSLQILPTILDLLIETGSLSGPNAEAAKQLAANYEGQSMIRNLLKSHKDGENAQPDWQFTVINPGGPMVGVREPSHDGWRLIVPILENVEWRFTNLKDDPAESDPILGFGFPSFLSMVHKKRGEEEAKWVEKAAFATRWWVEENRKRWRQGKYADM